MKSITTLEWTHWSWVNWGWINWGWIKVGSISVRGTSAAPRTADAVLSRRERARQDRARVEGYGPIAGVLLLAGALLSIPGSLLIQPPSETYLLTALVALTGLVCLAMPWERISPAWLHALGVIGTLEVGASVAFIDYAYGFYFVVIAALVAHGARNRLETGAHLILISATLLAPIAWEPEHARAIVREAMLLVPSIALVAGVVIYLRERLEAKQRMYRRFAEEAFELTWRIRGIPAPGEIAEPALLGAPIRRPPRSRPASPLFGRLRVPAAVASVLLTLPLATTGLAAAGVTLPAVVVESLERLGITLPNQPAADSGGAGQRQAPAHKGAPSAGGTKRSTAGEDRGGDRADRPGRVSRLGDGSDGAVTGTEPATPPAVVPTPGSPVPVPAPVGGGSGGDGGGRTDLGRTLRDAAGALDQVLSNLDLPALKR
jgi:hypothetical protein